MKCKECKQKMNRQTCWEDGSGWTYWTCKNIKCNNTYNFRNKLDDYFKHA